MDNRVVFLTAKVSQGASNATPRVVSVMEETISSVIPGRTATSLGLTKVKAGRDLAVVQDYTVYESPLEVEAARNPLSSDIFVKGKVKTGLTTLGANQGAALALVGYINEITGGTATTADGVSLPAGVLNKVVTVINNHATMTAKVYPATGEFIDALAVNANTTILPGKRKTFVVQATTGKWITADDYTQD